MFINVVTFGRITVWRELDLPNMHDPNLLFKTKLGFIYDGELCVGYIDRWDEGGGGVWLFKGSI